MTPLQFEARHGASWRELDAALARLEGTPTGSSSRLAGAAGPGNPGSQATAEPIDAARLAALYRRACEQLALARSRAYPIHLTQQLEALTERAHQAIYRRHDFGSARLKQLLLIDFPQAVRAQRWKLLVAALVFVLPTLLTGWAAWRDPGFLLTVMDAQHARHFDEMYGDPSHAIGRMRNADTDWQMFGFYIMNNIGVSFRCFAGGIVAGLGTLFFLAYNGVESGAVAGYLTARGHADTFYPFVVTHGAFELTAIVISGAAGLGLGQALLAPGRRGRLQALQHAAREAMPLMIGVIAMLVIAAALEAFWSSAQWVIPQVKYGTGAACWLLVLVYLSRQGRPSPAAAPGRPQRQRPAALEGMGAELGDRGSDIAKVRHAG